MNSRYPPNWKAIADQVKAEALGRCQRCGWVCDGSSRDRVLQVHHWDRDPGNNERSNLIALCPACHLDYHRGENGNVSEGQLSLFVVESVEVRREVEVRCEVEAVLVASLEVEHCQLSLDFY